MKLESGIKEMISFLPLAAIKRIKRGRAAGTWQAKKKKKKNLLVTMETMKMTFREPCDCFQRKSLLAFQL